MGRAHSVVFLLVAVLMTTTAMTRMVEDRAVIIGVSGPWLASGVVVLRYLLSLLAYLFGGGVTGLLSQFLVSISILLIVIKGLYIAVANTTGCTAPPASYCSWLVWCLARAACRSEIRHTPALAVGQLEAPKAGARILLERISRPVWAG